MDTSMSAVLDRSGFENAVLPLTPTLYGKALRLCRDADEADDLVQDTVIRAWRFWASYKEGSNVSAWLRRILTNSFLSECRRTGRQRRLNTALASQGQTATTAVEPASWVGEGFGDEVVAALDAIPAEYRQVLLMVEIEGLAYREAAEKLRCPVGTIMSRLHRGRRALRVALCSYAATVGYPDAVAADASA